jgi:serine/threonine protein kinase
VKKRSDLIGQTIGNYTITRRLGAGGMGEVYEAQHPTIGARVAIKVLNADATDPASAQRFLIEAQAVNRIQHDGVVKIIDAGYTPEDRPYLVMEYLDGASLADVMKGERRVPMGTACRIVGDVLAVLAEAHGEGIVHRDLKPHNVFLTRSGRTVVLDFGVAKLLDAGGSVSLTMTGAILGTPAYMAPEQIQGEAVDGRSDLYAVGVVLYELVTGRRPFDADQTFDLLTAHVERRPPPPRAIRPDVPEKVQSVLMAALAKDPDQRFQTAEAMRTALLQAAVELPAAAFAPVDMPSAPKRTPTVPPTGSGPVAAAAAELASPTVPGKPRAQSGPNRVADLAALASTAEHPAASEPTIRARPRSPSRPGPPVTGTGNAGASASASASTSASGTDEAMAPADLTFGRVRRSRRNVILVAAAIGVVAVIAAFVIGRSLGRDGTSNAATPGPSTLVVTPLPTGEDARGSLFPLDGPAPAHGVDLPPVPQDIIDALIKRRLHLFDLRPEVLDYLRTAAKGGAAAAELPAMIPQLVAEIDRTQITRALVDAKDTRVAALAATVTLPDRLDRLVDGEMLRAGKSSLKGDPIAANEHLWRAEWVLEHQAAPPW